MAWTPMAVAICVLPVPGPPMSTMFSVSSRNSQRCRGFVNATFTVRFSQLASVSANASSLLTLFLTGYFGCVSPLAGYFLIVVRDKAGPFCNLSHRQMLAGVPATNYT